MYYTHKLKEEVFKSHVKAVFYFLEEINVQG